MKILAFDLGATMGIASNTPEPWARHLELRGDVRPHRFSSLIDFLNARNWHLYDVVVYETPFVRGLHATRSGWGIAGIIEAIASQHGRPVIDVSVATIKKFATGDGRAPKDAMIKAAQRLGYPGSNEHAADAFCLMRYAEKNLERVMQ